MYNVPSPVWNQIAQEVDGLPRDFQAVCELDGDGLKAFLEKQARYLQSLGYPNEAVLAFQVSLPSLAAYPTLEEWMYRKGHHDLIPSVPIVDPSFLPEIMTQEYALNGRSLQAYKKLMRDPRGRKSLRTMLPSRTRTSSSSSARPMQLA